MKIPTQNLNEGYLPTLPATHQALYDQERNLGRIARVMSALVIDHEVPDSERGIIVVADLASALGRVFASVFSDVQDVEDEIRNATFQERSPVVVEGIWERMVVECLQELIPGGVELAERRSTGALVLLVIDAWDRPAMTNVIPVVATVGPGPN